MKAVGLWLAVLAKRVPPFDLFTKKEGLRYSTAIPISSGRLNTPNSSSSKGFEAPLQPSISGLNTVSNCL